MKKSISSKRDTGKKLHEKQIGIRDFMMVLIKSRIPWVLVVFLFLFNVFYNRILLSIPTTTGRLMGGDLSAGALSEALIGYGLYAAFAVLQYLIKAFSYAVTSRRARFHLWDQMLKIDETFFDKVDSTDLQTAVTYDIGSALPGMVNLIVAVIPDIIYVVKALLLIKSYDVILMIVMILFIPLKLMYMFVVGRWVHKTEAKLRTQTGVLTSRLDERLKNLSLIKAFNKEADETEVGGEYINDLYKANVDIAKLGGISLLVQQGIELSQKFILMVIAVVLLQQGRIDIAQWIAFFLFTSNLSTKFDALIEDWMSVKTITGNLERPVKLYRASVEDMNADGETVDTKQSFDIVFDDVSFRYGEKKALSHISLAIPEGQKVAIVGKTGSGKSTTLSLIERFYQPSEGKITIGSVPISDFKLSEYRNLFAYVPQANQVFSGTIRDALLYGNEKDISDNIIMENAAKTGFAQYISLQKNGLDAPLSNSEVMSGGQLQKLILTRENMRDSRIVLLDEPVSALDAESTLMVKKLVTEELQEKTVIMVTHDLSFVDSMDQIILMEDGELLASGSFKELSENCEPFRVLLATQGREVSA